MQYKDFENKLNQLIKTECNKHIGTNLGSGRNDIFKNWHSVIDEIMSPITQFINDELKCCELSSRVYYKNANIYIAIKNHLSSRFFNNFAINFIQITLEANIKNLEDGEIISIQTSINRIPVYSSKMDLVFSTSHPFLKSYQNKKIKLKDDIVYLTRKFYEELEKEYKIKYFNLVKGGTEFALELYINHILKNDFTSLMFCSRVASLDYVLNPYTSGIKLNQDEVMSFRQDLNKSLTTKRIYSVCFEIFENDEKIKEENYQSLPMSQIRYYHSYLKDSFFEKIHTPACGTALIRMTITNIFTEKVKTIDDIFCY